MNFFYHNLANQQMGFGQGWQEQQLDMCQQTLTHQQYPSQLYFPQPQQFQQGQDRSWTDPSQYEFQQEVSRAEPQREDYVRRPVAPIDFRQQDPIQITKAKAKRTRKKIVQTTVKLERDQLRKEVKDLEDEMRELKFKLVRSQAKVRTMSVSGLVHKRGGASMAEKDSQVRNLQRELEDMRKKLGKKAVLQQREVDVAERERKVKEEEDRLKAWNN